MQFFQKGIEHFFLIAAVLSALLTAAIFLLFFKLGLPFFQESHFTDLIFSIWQPDKGRYGIYPMIVSSLSVAFISLCISFPMSLGSAFLITLLAPVRFGRFLLNMVRFMTGIPTVIYGFVAIFLLVPFMRETVTRGSGMCILTAALVLALLIAPTMIIFFVNSMRQVPLPYTQAIDALGGSKAQKLLYVILPHAWPGILAGMLLGLGRAMGDTMVSLMIAGNAIAVPSSIFDSARTLTAHIALVIAADFASMEFKSIFACGIFLYIFTAVLVLLLRMTGGLIRQRI